MTSRIFLASQDEVLSGSVCELLHRQGYEVDCLGGDAPGSLEETVVPNGPDLILLDLDLPGDASLRVFQAVQSSDAHRFTPILMLAGSPGQSDRFRALKAGCNDVLQKPIHPEELFSRMGSLLKLKHLTDDTEDVRRYLIELAGIAESKDPHSVGHAERVAQYAVLLGEVMGLPREELDVLHTGGLLHDVGKVAVPDAIISKPGKFTSSEYDSMKRHPLIGAEILRGLPSLQSALPIVQHHHERLDGTGYPVGLSGESIPLIARIVSVVDVYDALRSRRSYKEEFSRDESFRILHEETDAGWWDSEVFSQWERLVKEAEMA